MIVGIARTWAFTFAALWAAPAFAQDNQLLDDALALAAIPPAFEAEAAARDETLNLLIAAHRTTVQRYSDSFLTSGKPRRRPVATSMRLRRQDDANFTNRTRFLARRVEEMGRPVLARQRGVATTGEEFLATLIEASKRGPIANFVSTATPPRARCSRAKIAASTRR